MRSTLRAAGLRLVVPAALMTGLLASCAAPAAGAAAPAAPGSAVAVVPAPAVVVAAVTTAAPEAARPSIYSGRVYAFGDSVMLGARAQLRQRLHAAVYAVESRQSGSVLAQVRQMTAARRILGPVVIHTGTNGTIVQSVLDRTVRAIQSKHLVVLVNVKLPARYKWTRRDNAIIAAIAKKYSHVVMVDWAGRSRGHANWFYRDGIHLKPAGRVAYTHLIAAALHR